MFALDCTGRFELLKRYPYPQRTHMFKAFGPKDPIVEGFWAILMLRGRVGD